MKQALGASFVNITSEEFVYRVAGDKYSNLMILLSGSYTQSKQGRARAYTCTIPMYRSRALRKHG